MRASPSVLEQTESPFVRRLCHFQARRHTILDTRRIHIIALGLEASAELCTSGATLGAYSAVPKLFRCVTQWLLSHQQQASHSLQDRMLTWCAQLHSFKSASIMSHTSTESQLDCCGLHVVCVSPLTLDLVTTTLSSLSYHTVDDTFSSIVMASCHSTSSSRTTSTSSSSAGTPTALHSPHRLIKSNRARWRPPPRGGLCCILLSRRPPLCGMGGGPARGQQLRVWQWGPLW